MINKTTRMVRFILVPALVAGLLLFAGCGSDAPPSRSPVGKTMARDEALPDCRVLMVIMEDRSGSTAENRKLTVDDYRRIAERFADRFSGVIAARVIGNPAPEDRNFFRFEVPAPRPYKEVPEGATLSERAKVKQRNQEIAAENRRRREEARARLGEWLQRVEQRIVQYKPVGRGVTDIRDALIHLDGLIAEPTFRNYDQVVVVLLSDGVHDADRKPVEGLFRPRRPVILNLIGWENPEVFGSDVDVQQFESKDGFLAWWDEFEC